MPNVETILLISLGKFSVSVLIVILFKKLGIKVGNASDSRIMRADKSEIVFTGIILAPIIEELIFRGLPMLLSRSIAMAIITSFIFALLHGIEDEKGNIKLPIPQFFGGLISWGIAGIYGLPVAMLIHALHNGLAIIGMLVVSDKLHWRKL